MAPLRREPGISAALANLGWLDQEKKDWPKDGTTWAETEGKLVGADAIESSLISRIKEVVKFRSEEERERIISGMRWMGILSSEGATVIGGNYFRYTM